MNKVPNAACMLIFMAQVQGCFCAFVWSGPPSGTFRCPVATTPLMQSSNAGEALKKLQQTKAAKIALSKFETYTIQLKKPMGLVFEEFATSARGVYVAGKNKETTHADNLRSYSDTPSTPFDEITVFKARKR